MRIQKIEKHIIGLLHITCIASVNRILKILIGQTLINPEILNTLSQWIVHNGIKFIPAKPRKCIVPDFSEDINIRVNFLHSGMQFLTESMRYLICHIQTDSVNTIMFHPVCTDVYKIFSNFRVIGIDFRHSIIKGKCINLFFLCSLSIPVKRPFIYHKPVIIF